MPKVRFITEADVPAAIDLLTRGFGSGRKPRSIRPRSFWEDVLTHLRHRVLPDEELPRYGYVIENDGKLVGILLLIFSTIWKDGNAKIRCNGLGWYVEPAFRLWAPMLIKKCSDCKEATVLNLTPAANTFAVIEALSYVRYCGGIFASVPLLGGSSGEPVMILDGHAEPDVPFDPHDRDLLIEHADCGCTSLWCVTPKGAYPFVFRIRWLRGIRCAQLVYCRDEGDFARFARPIGRSLARSWCFFVLLDTKGPVAGLLGRYFRGKVNRYFRGSDPPRLGDLAYTEIALFGLGP